MRHLDGEPYIAKEVLAWLGLSLGLTLVLFGAAYLIFGWIEP
jgi:hypothetical protein